MSLSLTSQRARTAGPGERPARRFPRAHANAPVRTGRVAAGVAMPLADLMALAATAAVAGLAGGLGGWLLAGYAAAVFLVLSALGLHRLRICLRVGDQSGRIIMAAAVPALAVAPWITAGQAVALAAGHRRAAARRPGGRRRGPPLGSPA